MKINYTDEAIDAILVKALAVHFEENFTDQEADSPTIAPDPDPELPETFSELKRIADEKANVRAALLAPIFAMNRDQAAESYDEPIEDELRRAREEARNRIISTEQDAESK